jgi:hypothetical protein
LKGGIIPESDSKRVTDKYDDAPNSWIFGVYVENCLAGSIRLHLLTRDCRESMCAAAYSDIIYPRLDLGEVMIDSARFVVDPDVNLLELPYQIVRLAYVACEAFDGDTCIVACGLDHNQSFAVADRNYLSIHDARCPS